MPCAYTIRPDGKVDYWEEAVCALSLHANCYCYSINAQQGGGYCIPGYKTAGSIHVSTLSVSTLALCMRHKLRRVLWCWPKQDLHSNALHKRCQSSIRHAQPSSHATFLSLAANCVTFRAILPPLSSSQPKCICWCRLTSRPQAETPVLMRGGRCSLMVAVLSPGSRCMQQSHQSVGTSSLWLFGPTQTSTSSGVTQRAGGPRNAATPSSPTPIQMDQWC